MGQAPSVMDSVIDLHKAAWKGDVDAVNELLAEGVDVDGKTESQGRTALHLAVLGNRPAVIHALAHAGAEVDVADFDGVTPLMLAARNGMREAAVALMGHSANPLKEDAGGRTALSVATDELREVVRAATHARKHGAQTPHEEGGNEGEDDQGGEDEDEGGGEEDDEEEGSGEGDEEEDNREGEVQRTGAHQGVPVRPRNGVPEVRRADGDAGLLRQLQQAKLEAGQQEEEMNQMAEQLQALREHVREYKAERDAALQKLRTLADEHEDELQGVSEARELQVRELVNKVRTLEAKLSGVQAAPQVGKSGSNGDSKSNSDEAKALKAEVERLQLEVGKHTARHADVLKSVEKLQQALQQSDERAGRFEEEARLARAELDKVRQQLTKAKAEVSAQADQLRRVTDERDQLLANARAREDNEDDDEVPSLVPANAEGQEGAMANAKEQGQAQGMGEGAREDAQQGVGGKGGGNKRTKKKSKKAKAAKA